MPAFAQARSLYASAGFTVCEPFGDYQPRPTSIFMTLALDRPAQRPRRGGVWADD